MRKKINVAWTKNKTSAELKRIFPEFVLVMAGVMRSLSSFCIIAAQEMQEIGGLQLRCAIGLTLFVYEERESNSSFLAKLPGINGVTEPDCSQNCSFVTKGLFVFAQLRDVLTAKDSAVVTQENYDSRSFIPQGSEPRFAVVAVRNRDKGEPIAEGSFHGPSILLSALLAVKRSSSSPIRRLFAVSQLTSRIRPGVVLRWRTEKIIHRRERSFQGTFELSPRR
jgi:hypothetical protein